MARNYTDLRHKEHAEKNLNTETLISDLQPLFKMLDAKASKQDLQAVWRSTESAYADKASLQLVASQLSKFATHSDLAAALSYVATEMDQVKTYSRDTTISSAELLALNATPKELVPAPGTGLVVEVVRIEFFLDYETAPYTVAGGQDLSLEYSGGGQILQVETTGWLDQSSDQRRCAHHGEQHAVGVNEGVTLKMLAGEVSVGDSPLKCRVDYRIVKVLT